MGGRYIHPFSLLSVKGHTIRALLCSRIALVSADHDTLQGAVVLIAAMMLALRDSALDAAICVFVHCFPSLCFVARLVCAIFHSLWAEKLDTYFVLIYNCIGSVA